MKLPSLTRRKQWLPLGFDLESNQPLRLALNFLTTHLWAVGPPGSGKTRLLLWLFEQLCQIPNATVILINTKGDLGLMARDWAIGHGHTNRLIWFDPQDEERIIGYNPLQPNHLPVATHAKNVREAIRSAWGQGSFDQTAQLARFLFLVLFAVRELTLTLTEALDLLRPGSPTRTALLASISDPYIRQELAYVDGLRADRQDQLLASTLARLQSFVLDPAIRRIITQQTHNLSLSDVTRGSKILILNFELYKPLTLDDIRLLSRFFINDLVAHAFRRPKGQRSPIYLILDEAQNCATTDLCRALDQGRELNLSCLLGNQYLAQLREQEETGLLADSVMKCVRTKILFGGLSTDDLEYLVPEVMIDRFDPWLVKDELKSLELEPVESTREVLTEGESQSNNVSQTVGSSQATSSTQAQGRDRTTGTARGVSRETGVSESQGETETLTVGNDQIQGGASSRGRGSSSGLGSASSQVLTTGESRRGDFRAGGEVERSSSEARGTTNSRFSSATENSSETDSWSDSESRSAAHGISLTKGRSASHGQSITHTQSEGVSESESHTEQQGQNHSRSAGQTVGKTTSKALTPWYEYRKRWVVSSRQFLTKDEQMTLALQQVKAQPKAHFLLDVPDHQAVFMRAPYVKTPWITARRRREGLERIYSQACYSTPQEIAKEEEQRTRHLQELLPASSKAAKIKSKSPHTLITANSVPGSPDSDEPIKTKQQSHLADLIDSEEGED